MPNVRAAGKSLKGVGPSAAECLTMSEEATRALPLDDPHRRFRRATWIEPGTRVLHPGVADDRIPVGDDHRFGKTTDKGQRAGDCLHPKPLSTFEQYRNEVAERVYVHRDKHLLGRSFHHHHELPEHTRSPEFRFGQTTSKDESAKELLQPPDEATLTREVDQELYKRTHRDFAPGEQVKRSYNWQATSVRDPTAHRFGKTEPIELDGARKALTFADASPSAETVIRPKLQKDTVRVMSVAPAGVARTRGVAPENVATMTHGVRTLIGAGPTAGDLVSGAYTAEQLAPDPSIGKCTKPGSRNMATERSFGLPSIRTDVRAPGLRSVANVNNYGDEATAKELIRPSKYSDLGVQDDDFLTPLDPDELHELLASAGIDDVSDAEFRQIVEFAQDQLGRIAVSVDEFRQAMLYLHTH